MILWRHCVRLDIWKKRVISNEVKKNWNFLVLGAIQIIRDTFLPYFRPPPPPLGVSHIIWMTPYLKTVGIFFLFVGLAAFLATSLSSVWPPVLSWETIKLWQKKWSNMKYNTNHKNGQKSKLNVLD